MECCKLLFDKNPGLELQSIIKKKIQIKNKRVIYRIRSKIFGGDQIYEILAVMNYIHAHYRQKIPITFDLGFFEFYDKLVYVILESIIYYLYKDERYDIDFCGKANDSIYTEGIQYSPMNFVKSTDEYIKKFVNDLSMRHFRRLIPNEDQRDEKYLSDLMQQIFCFLCNNGIGEEICEQLTEVLVELVGNAGEHGNSECLLDVDITQSTYKKSEKDNDIFYGMNAAVLNYSSMLFYEPLKKKLCSEIELPKRYDYVLIAKDYHLKNLTENYFENDFYTVSSFQHKISGNIKKNDVGGTGLTSLLQSLEEQSDTHLCYMLSANRILFFEKNLMHYDQDKLVGFNINKNYLTEIPDEKLFQSISTFLPGVAYNLNYVIKKEW